MGRARSAGRTWSRIQLCVLPLVVTWEVCELGQGNPLVVAPRLAEHCVVDCVLGLEVRVERRRSHAHSLGQVAQGELGQTVLSRELPPGRTNLRVSCLAAFGSPIAFRNS
jgi:hypothetical protein